MVTSAAACSTDGCNPDGPGAAGDVTGGCEQPARKTGTARKRRQQLMRKFGRQLDFHRKLCQQQGSHHTNLLGNAATDVANLWSQLAKLRQEVAWLKDHIRGSRQEPTTSANGGHEPTTNEKTDVDMMKPDEKQLDGTNHRPAPRTSASRSRGRSRSRSDRSRSRDRNQAEVNGDGAESNTDESEESNELEEDEEMDHEERLQSLQTTSDTMATKMRLQEQEVLQYVPKVKHAELRDTLLAYAREFVQMREVMVEILALKQSLQTASECGGSSVDSHACGPHPRPPPKPPPF